MSVTLGLPVLNVCRISLVACGTIILPQTALAVASLMMSHPSLPELRPHLCWRAVGQWAKSVGFGWLIVSSPLLGASVGGEGWRLAGDGQWSLVRHHVVCPWPRYLIQLFLIFRVWVDGHLQCV
eukprot:1749244-Amphidinium_carterae.1